jgi:hypothetical protein
MCSFFAFSRRSVHPETPGWNSAHREACDSHLLHWENCSWVEAGLGQKSPASFFVSGTSQFPPLSFIKVLERFLPVDIIRWEISDKTPGLSDSQKGPLRPKPVIAKDAANTR